MDNPVAGADAHEPPEGRPEGKDSPSPSAQRRLPIPPADSFLDQAVTAIGAELNRTGRPADFSDQALESLLQRQAEYVEDLGVHAIRKARRERLDQVSASHIDDAASDLSSGQSRTRAVVLQTVGGAILGTGGGQLFAVLTSQDPSTLAYLLAVLGLLVGTVLTVLGFARR